VNAGEEGTARPGQAPTKRVILNPENAVQWALYYPVDPSWRDLPAAALLAGGDAAGARRELDTALAADARALRPLVLLSTIELTQNRVDAAVDAANRALAVDPNYVPALVAASEAEQARFDLRAARRLLDQALQQDPRHVHALVNRARIRFGTGDTAGAKLDADAAAAVSPDDPRLRSLRGFIRIADGDAVGARADFAFAAQADTEFGEPHLGLGLVHFRQNRVEDGLNEMLTATLLEPHVSLYQSYLGKAYYQAHRLPEGLSALASAKRLDPRDPTPWLYTSLFLRDQNRQVDALNELRAAIELNDHRAVYRSRLLLDRDLATKNVSLAEIYRQLGFEASSEFMAS
jgi:tetratricopeptide (TPR) repeat protein